MLANLVIKRAFLCFVNGFHTFHQPGAITDALTGMDQRFDVFGKTRSAITCAGINEVITNSRISANAAPYGFDVGTKMISEVSQFIHQTDPRGQHYIGRILGQFC